MNSMIVRLKKVKTEPEEKQGKLFQSLIRVCRVFLIACCFFPLILPAQAAQRKTQATVYQRKVGGYVTDKNQHATLLMIGNIETGEWVKAFAVAKPAEIADQVIKPVEAKP